MQSQVQNRFLPNYEEFSTKHLVEKGFIPVTILNKFFPARPDLVDRQFAWCVWETTDEETAEKYFDQVMNTRDSSPFSTAKMVNHLASRMTHFWWTKSSSMLVC